MFNFIENNTIFITNAILLVALGFGVSALRQLPASVQSDTTQDVTIETPRQLSPEITPEPIESISNPNSSADMRTRIPRRPYEDYDDDDEGDDD